MLEKKTSFEATKQFVSIVDFDASQLNPDFLTKDKKYHLCVVCRKPTIYKVGTSVDNMPGNTDAGTICGICNSKLYNKPQNPLAVWEEIIM